MQRHGKVAVGILEQGKKIQPSFFQHNEKQRVLKKSLEALENIVLLTIEKKKSNGIFLWMYMKHKRL